MKTVYMIRHAKSSWGDFTTPDFERPLNERGKKDAPVMAERLKNKAPHIDIFVSSTAKRAAKTCKAFVKEFKYREDDILFTDELYHAAVATFYKVISQLPNKHKSAALFSHNPGITEFVNSLNTQVKLDNMPTCGIYGVSADIDNWEDFFGAEKKCILFDYPKMNSSEN